MAAPTSADFAQVSALLQEGKTQEADDRLKELTAQASDAEREAAGLPKEPPPPRPPDEVMLDLLESLSAHIGHPPRVAALLEELKAVTAKR